MKYSELPNYSIICYSNYTLLAEAQKKLTKALITHTAIKKGIHVQENGLSLVKNGVQHTLFKNSIKHSDINNLYALIPDFEIDNKKAIQTTKLAMDIKIRYSVKNLFYLLFYKFTNIWVGNINEKTQVCSQYTAWWFNKVANKFPKPYSYSPQRVFDEAELNGFKIVKIEI